MVASDVLHVHTRQSGGLDAIMRDFTYTAFPVDKCKCMITYMNDKDVSWSITLKCQTRNVIILVC
jgi:hypothetical protein